MKGLNRSKKSSLVRFVEKQLESFLTYDLKERAVYSKREHLTLLLSTSMVNGFATGVSNALGYSPTGETLLSYIKTQKKEILKAAALVYASKIVREEQVIQIRCELALRAIPR